MAKKKNLTKDDIEDVSTYESYAKSTNGNGNGASTGIRFNDVQVKVKCLNEKQKLLKTAIETNEMVISIGPAGTGKTFLSLVTALHLMKTQPVYKRLILVKSLVVIKGEEVGFLPGPLEEKIAPYMYSFTGNLDKIFGSKFTTISLIEKGVIEFAPLAYVRGVTIDDAIVIIDETQNMELGTFKTIATRIGKNCKMIFLGDVEQIDRKDPKESCLQRVYNRYIQKDFVGTVQFSDSIDDQVRNPIITKILEALKDMPN